MYRVADHRTSRVFLCLMIPTGVDVTRNERESGANQYALTALYALIGLVYLAVFIYLFEALMSTYFTDLGSAVETLSGLSSLILVALTALYVRETRRIVETERELRRKDAVEDWYESVLSVVRQLTFELDYQLATRGDRDGIEFEPDGQEFQTLQSLVQSLEAEARRSPSGVDPELIDELDDFFYEWRQLKSSNRVVIPHDSDAEITLLEIKDRLERASERFGRQ